MLKVFKFRIYPTSKQQELINNHIGSSRFVYNFALETKKKAYADNQINLSCFDLINQLPDLKKDHRLAKSISDMGWSMFVDMLEYKAEWYGVNLLKIGKFEPSSKTCSTCGSVNKKLTLKDRVWTCSNCKTKHDRDFNAAKNIKNIALSNRVSGTDTQIQEELPTVVGVMTPEAHQSLVDG